MNIKSLLKTTGNAEAFIAAESQDTTTFIDTGSYSLNALLSGSIYGGLADNRITCLAGEQAQKLVLTLTQSQCFIALL